MYVQIMGYGDFTKINIPYGDMGGELDPHGAYGDGNPIGGNVTTNVPGSDLNVAEWMQFISYNQFCIRACTNANGTFDAPSMCEHKLDEVGCMFVMPGNYNFNNTFETCEAEVALPPGWYPTATVDGKVEYSTFAQYFSKYCLLTSSSLSNNLHSRYLHCQRYPCVLHRRHHRHPDRRCLHPVVFELQDRFDHRERTRCP
jgi:hypothetical protein